MRFKRFFFVLVILFFFLCSISFSLEPRLLWKMEIKEVITDASFANLSGDIVIAIDDRIISLINKNGNIVNQWGPDLRKSVWCPSISADGKYIAFISCIPTESEFYNEGYIYYFDRKGKEIWKYEACCELPWVSPDGRFVFVGVMGGLEGPSLLLDKDKKTLWKNNVGHAEDVLFSPDGNYFIVEPSCLLIDIQNKKIIRSFPAMEVTSISENAEYVGLIGRKEEEGLYNKEGKLILKGKFVISGDGRVVVKDSEGRIDVFKFPEMERIVSYPVKGAIRISNDGRIIAIIGHRIVKDTPYKLFIGNTDGKALWEGAIPQLEKANRFFLSKDGRYLAIMGKTFIYYFQIF